jgi:putative transposase
MPSKNSRKYFQANGVYHIYNRGAHKVPIFVDDDDKNKLLSLFARHLDPKEAQSRCDNIAYRKYHEDIEIVSYCLMDNHFHLLVHQIGDGDVVPKFMQAVMVSYTMYFNLRHNHQGTIFQGVYKSSDVDDYQYLHHITRYIHRNPRYFKSYKYSSYRFFIKKQKPRWLHPEKVLTKFSSKSTYKRFVEDEIDIESSEFQKEIKARFKM